MPRKPKQTAAQSDKKVTFAVQPVELEEGKTENIPFDNPSDNPSNTLNETNKSTAQSQAQPESNEVERLNDELQKAMQQTAQLSATVNKLQKVMRDIIPHINQLISGLELAQQKGVFTLKQASLSFAAIENVSSLLQSS